jgi:hypothetical protein
MNVDGVGKIRPGVPGKIGAKTNGTTDARFAGMVNTGEEAPAAASVSTTAPLSSVDSLLSLQEVDDVSERKSRARKRATGLLDELDNIRHGLLMGEIPPHQLHLLRDKVASARPEVDDPQLTSILDDIELRAEVELAKLEMAAKGE